MAPVAPISEIELVYKSKVLAADRAVVTTAHLAAQLIRPYFDSNKMELQEQAAALYLNARNRVLGIYRVSIGGVTQTIMDARLVLAAALKLPTTGIIVAHSHPSGNLKPSRADIELTLRLKAAAALLTINLLDHLILTQDGYYSMADEGDM